MKKAVVALLIVALIGLVLVLILRPGVLEQIRGGTEHGADSTESVSSPPADERSASPAATATDKRAETPVKQPSIAIIRLDHLAERAIYVNGMDRTGDEAIEVAPGTILLATWQDGHWSHQRLKLQAGDEVTPEASLESATAGRSWSGFQGGPARTGLVEAGPRSGFSPRWTGRVEDEVRSSPVILGDIACFGSDTSFLHAVDLDKGTLLWSHGIVGSKTTPVAVGDFVFAGNVVGSFEGFRSSKGKLKGTTSLGSGLAGLARLSDDVLLAVTSGNALTAVATRKSMVGRLPLKHLWEITLPGLGGSTATPLVLGDRVILQTADHQLLAVSAADGSVIWPAGTVVSTGPEALPESGSNMSFRFGGTGGFLTPTPAAVDGVIYTAGGNRVRGVNADDGEQLWERTFDGEISSSVSAAWGAIYFGCSDGTVRSFSCDGGEPIFSARLGELPIFASPVLSDGRLLAATGEGKLFLLDAFSGTVMAEDDTLAGSPIDATPAVWPDGILAINRDGDMVCFE